MKQVYDDILKAVSQNKKLLAVLIDPDKFNINDVPLFLEKVNQSIATHVFVGGSTVEAHVTEQLVLELQQYTELPIVLFPGDTTQITNQADALLFLSLISGRNPEYLIGKHVASISKLRDSDLEIISTGYVLIESGKETAVQKVTQTQPLSRAHIKLIADTAKAGEFLGMKLIYLEAGSGALQPITNVIIKCVKQALNVPLIIGGGIQSKTQLENAYKAGADLVVIGTAFEKDETFFNALKKN